MRNPIAYDAVMAPFERLLLGRWRRWTVAGLGGRVLEIGAGTGFTLPHYSCECEVVLSEPSLPMLLRAQSRAGALTTRINFVATRAEELPFQNATFDAVVVTLALCTVRDPAKALSEIYRVMKPGGQLRLFEHVRVPSPPVAALQDILTPAWRALSGGCHLNRDTLTFALSAGFEPVEVKRGGGGWLLAARLRRPGSSQPG